MEVAHQPAHLGALDPGQVPVDEGHFRWIVLEEQLEHRRPVV